jgi:hypothetical protein
MTQIGIGTKLYRRERKGYSQRYEYKVFEIVRETEKFWVLNNGEKLNKSKSMRAWDLELFDDAAAAKKKESDFENEAHDKLGIFTYYFNRGDISREKVVEMYKRIKELL